MATAWDDTNYPLTDRTTFMFESNNDIQTLSDGAVRSRILSSVIPVELKVQLAPRSGSESATLQGVFAGAAAIEWEITYNGYVYTGFIDSRSIRLRMSEGAVYWWSFTLKGVSTLAP